MWSVPLINTHFWLATGGTVLYIAAMWVNGITQGLMRLAFNADGTLTYSFIESVEASYGGYIVRAIGGGLFFIGILIMAFNVYKTILVASEEATYLEEKPDTTAQVA
jgi:cytochrome c oxidase cbb3-type subunit 1